MTVAAAAAAAVPQPAWPAAPQTDPARRQPDSLGRRCRRCCCYCGIGFIAICALLFTLYLICYFINFKT